MCKVRQWHENGKMKSIGEYEHGVELRYDEWSDNDAFLTSRQVDTGSALFKYLQQMRGKTTK